MVIGSGFGFPLLARIKSPTHQMSLPALVDWQGFLLGRLQRNPLPQCEKSAHSRDCSPACEVGSLPPFVNLCGMDVFVGKPLPDNEETAFNAGSHTELVRLGYKDFERLVRPKIADFAVAG